MLGISAIGKRTKRGFTLLELLIVISIMVLLASAFPVALDRTLPGRRVASTVQKVVVAIDDARAKSAACSCAVRLELRDRDLSLSAAVPNQTLLSPNPISIPRSTRVSLIDMDGRSTHTLEIFPDGSTSGGRFEIVDGRQRNAITVGEITGRVRVTRAN
jgi:general secretion pathway protein H